MHAGASRHCESKILRRRVLRSVLTASWRHSRRPALLWISERSCVIVILWRNTGQTPQADSAPARAWIIQRCINAFSKRVRGLARLLRTADDSGRDDGRT
jgi:hypothetical protein